jgi:hypothetical protein
MADIDRVSSRLLTVVGSKVHVEKQRLSSPDIIGAANDTAGDIINRISICPNITCRCD